MDMWYSSKQGKKDPKDNLEIIKASSLVSKVGTVSLGFWQARQPLPMTVGWCHPKPWEWCYQSCGGQAPAQQSPQRRLPLPRYQGMEPSRTVGTQPRQKSTERMRLLQRIPTRKMPSGAMWIWLLPWSQVSRATGVQFQTDSYKHASQASEDCHVGCLQQSHGGWYTPLCTEGHFHIPVGLAGRVSDERLFSSLEILCLPCCIWTCLGPATLFFPVSPFRPGRICPTACPTLFFGST